MLTAFIMAGGSGERFWPLSTKKRPKQLLKIFSDKSMIRETVDRILPIVDVDKIFVGTNILQAEAIKEELPMIPKENIIIEPLFKDTAAAIGYGATFISERLKTESEELIMIVLASDHLIKNEENFRKRLNTAVEIAKKGDIVTLGVKPTKPETGYGYIEVEECYVGEPCRVKRFWEKPSLERAEEYLASGNYLWNSGMFVFSTKTILKGIKKYLPNHGEIFDRIKKELKEDVIGVELSEKLRGYFEKFEKISIDFGVMEKADNIQVIPVDFGWNDVGSFPSLDEVFEKNENGSVNRKSRLIEVNSGDNIVLGNGNRIVATVGLKDIVVVDTEDAVLICKKSETQHIKKVLKRIEEMGEN